MLPTPWNVVAVVAAALGEAAEVMFWLAFLRRYRVSTGAEGLVGKGGEVVEPFSEGSGRVRVHGEIWAARNQGRLTRGERVRVVKVDGLTLEVEPQS